MLRTLLVASSLAWTVGCAGHATRLDSPFDEMRRSVADRKVPGAVAVVSHRGRVVRQEAYGRCDLEARRPMRVDTLCWIASITKPVTVAAAMKLVEAGKISLDDPVARHLPEFERLKGPDGRRQTVTIRQLMSHSSGIPSRPPGRPTYFFESGWLAREIAPVAKAVADLPLKFVPGRRVQYSNAAPYVLAAVIERRSGTSYARFVQTELLDPLGMNASFFALPPSESGRIADVIRRVDGAEDEAFFRFDPSWTMKMAMPDGGLFSTAGDILKFTGMFLENDGRVLTKESVRAMLTPQAPGWGLGWALGEDGSFHHTGSSGTLTWGSPRSGVAGVVFCQLQDYRTAAHESLKLRNRFRRSVETAFSGE